MFWLCLHKNIFIYISRLYLALFEAVSRRLSKAIKCIHKSQWFIKSWFGTLLLSIHFDIETLCCVVCVFSEKEYLQLPRGLGFNCEESVEFQVSNFRMMFSTRAQFHGSAFNTVSPESALTEAGNYVHTTSVFHGLAANLGFCACVLHVIRHSTLTRLAQKFGACT